VVAGDFVVDHVRFDDAETRRGFDEDVIDF